MTLKLTKTALAKIFPKAKPGAVDAFIAQMPVLEKAGWLETRTRLSFALAQIGHESGGMTIVIENIGYTAQRMAQVWPNRFRSADAVRAKYGTASGWQRKAFDDIYGNRMGNRPGTSDGSTYIGRGFIQITGRDGYRNVGQRAGLPLEAQPAMAAEIAYQPHICTGFWSWKNLNPVCDTGDFLRCTKIINGGTNGLADRKAWLARITPVVDALPGGPSTPKPPAKVIAAATAKERATRNHGAVVAGTGGAAEAAKTTGTVAADTPILSPFVTWTLIGAGVAIAIVAAVLIARKKLAIEKNWR